MGESHSLQVAALKAEGSERSRNVRVAVWGCETSRERQVSRQFTIDGLLDNNNKKKSEASSSSAAV